jgi:hypothetical protein
MRFYRAKRIKTSPKCGGIFARRGFITMGIAR